MKGYSKSQVKTLLQFQKDDIVAFYVRCARDMGAVDKLVTDWINGAPLLNLDQYPAKSKFPKARERNERIHKSNL